MRRAPGIQGWRACQAVLHKANGMIREERTYGKDPERTPGENASPTPPSAVESEILGEIEKARKKWGETPELKIIIGNWGDLYDDERMLAGIS